MKRVFKGLKQHGRSALRTHLTTAAQTAQRQLEGLEGAAMIEAMLQDRACVRYQTELVFDDAQLLPGTLGRVVPIQTDGGQRQFQLHLAARFATQPQAWPALVAYYIPTINYGRMPTADDSLSYGAALLGVDEDAYYQRLCALMDAA